ncbi:MAG TPA: hypothetical protein VJ765_05385, partial [Chitinophagaceae bacterium]|nr:hypothetical protein [Chitinophagaceae bacterium]
NISYTDSPRSLREIMLTGGPEDEWSVAIEAKSGRKGGYHKSLSGLRKCLFFILVIFAFRRIKGLGG